MCTSHRMKFTVLALLAAFLLPICFLTTAHAEHPMVQSLRESSFVFAGYDCSGKKEAMLTVAQDMLDAGYEPAFVAGLLGNIAREGDFGRFENIWGYTESRVRTVFSGAIAEGRHVYVAHMKGMSSIDHCGHDHSEYALYSNRHIYDGFSLQTVSAMLAAYQAENWNALFGLGTIQWSKGRTVTLVNFYRQAARGADTITKEQCMQAELDMMQYELSGPYHSVYTGWETAHPSDRISAQAAYDAGDRICRSYEGITSSTTRTNRAILAQVIYMVMTDGGSVTPFPSSEPSNTPAPTQAPTSTPPDTPVPTPTAEPTTAPTTTPTVSPTAQPETFALTPASVTIRLKTTRTFQLQVSFSDTQTHTVRFASSDPAIASVNSKGKITAKSGGTVVITATDESGQVRACRVQVKTPSVSFSVLRSSFRRQLSIRPKCTASYTKWQVQYRPAGSANWKSKKTSASTLKLGNLSSGIRYECRVRVWFAADNGKHYPTEWSKIRTVKVK